MNEFIQFAVSLAPVLLFLVALIFLDSYQLVPPRATMLAILTGAVVAVLSLVINTQLMTEISIERAQMSRYIAPVIEEFFKALFVIWLLKSGRIGFLVDAAIYGFAVGTGFSLIENIYYLQLLTSDNLLLWVLRGFGTAALHGGATAMFAIVAKGLAERHPGNPMRWMIVALIVAIVLHSLFNHFVLPPLWNTLAVMIGFPTILLLTFARSEQATRQWLGEGMDADIELLQSIRSGMVSTSSIGRYLNSIRDRFPGEVVADMFCYLQLHTELAIGAKGTLLLRQEGINPKEDDDIRARLTELTFLERSIGKTGRLALAPFLKRSSRDLWQIYMLRG